MSQPPITFDVRQMTSFLEDTRVRQMPFALSLALNATANDIQRAVQNRLQGRTFKIRSQASRQFVLRQIKRNPGEDFATKRRLVARVRIAKRTGPSLLSLIDQGGVRYSRFAIGSGATFGASSVVVPVRASGQANIPRSLYPTNTGLQQRRNIDGSFSKASLKGKRRTFAVRTGPQRGLVLQRVGRGKRGAVRVLFLIRPQTRVNARTFFAPAAESAATTRFDSNLRAGLQRALATAR